jgi:uncharacterized OB-fold protein
MRNCGTTGKRLSPYEYETTAGNEYYIYIRGEDDYTPVGWRCPECNNIHSPYVQTCPICSGRYTFTNKSF